MNPLVNPAALFRFRIPCRRRKKLWPPAAWDLDESCRLPAFAPAAGVPPAARALSLKSASVAVAAARVHGAAEIVATDVVDEPLAIARALGAHGTINVAQDSGWVQRYSAAKGTFDVMLECSGNQRALRDGLEVMRPRGVVVQLGLGGDISIPQNMVVAKELDIRGSFRFHAEFALAVRLINEGRIDLAPVVTHSFPMQQARQAFELASDRRQAMKVLIDFSEAALTAAA
jgi:L-idonate 5-dehydrogenase